ncbi:membrane protein insertase YidC [Thiomicrospira microaerophila]|uniref:membrane protein insertase YidC n=1 Tax=Thiomicrospira microaerophila TaxID=406020 RepID=UPI00200D0CCC|nr:membrane protein insertase YidC [Thiomicrospira microaerophila]UQB42336.1 membrane protein insertase YidC [Thiomicrospira microaerophila]
MNMRAFWWIALAFTAMWLWFQWMKFSASPPVDPNQVAIHADRPADVPMANMPVEAGTVSSQAGSDVPQAVTAMAQQQRIRVYTDTLHLEIDTLGGDIRDARTPLHGMPRDRNTPFHLMGDQGPLIYYHQNGIATPANAALPAPTHRSVFEVAQTEFRMEGDTLRVPMVWRENGIEVTKTYIFTRGSYLIDVEFEVTNQADQAWSGSLYSQFVRTAHDPYSSMMMYTYTGPVYYNHFSDDKKYNKISFSDIQTSPLENMPIQGGWAAMIQHYFVTAAVPNQNVTNSYFARQLEQGRYAIGVVEPAVTVAPGQTGLISSQIYIGPTEQNVLKQIAPGLERTIDYGMFTILAEPLFWLLNHINNIVGNWGWSIIVLTILIKLAFYWLSAKSYYSMAKLRKFQPKLKQLKENYGDDKVLFQQKMMKLYKEEKINPLGGCLPILVQMPVFIALYWVLIYSVEMRQAEWMLWITDLSTKDPYFVLPILMGLTMWIQQKLNPTAMMDEMQQKVMRLLPFIFTLFFMWFPAGLVLYWLMNNILSVSQQYYITKKIEKMDAKEAAAANKR